MMSAFLDRLAVARFRGWQKCIVFIGEPPHLSLRKLLGSHAVLQIIFRHWRKTGEFGGIAIFFLIVALVFVCLTAIQPESLRTFYKKWMMAAHFIGTLISSLLLAILFYLLFAPIGLVLRLMRKDLLDEQWESKQPSYWKKREQKIFDAKSYTRQY